MERICFTLELAPGTEEEYDRRHAEIWPDMSAAIRDAGIRNYTGFRSGTTVVYYGECHPDVATAFGAIGATDVNARWGASFQGIIVDITDAEGNLHTLTEVFHQD